MIAKQHVDFPSDVCLLLVMHQAMLSLSDGTHVVKVTVEDFLSGSDLAPGQIITQVEIPFPDSVSKWPDHVQSFKIMRRHMNTHAEVNAGFHFTFDGAGHIHSLRAVLGNLALGPLICEQTAAAVAGRPLSLDTLQLALAALRCEAKVALPSVADPPFAVADAAYRENLAVSLLFKAWLGAMIAQFGAESLPANLRSAATEFERPKSEGYQEYVVDSAEAPLGEPFEKIEGRIQASGEAKYTGDMDWPANTVVAHAVVADRVGVLAGFNVAAALDVDGVVDFISAETVALIGANNEVTGSPFQIFGAGLTKHVGQILGVVCATSSAAAAAGAAKVQVEWEVAKLACGPGESVLPDEDPIFIPAAAGETGLSTKVIQGGLSSTGQKHFYLETQVTFAVPDGDKMVVNCSTQSFDDAQKILASTLNMQQNNVVVQNVRIGGAYGGKAFIYSGVAAAACVAAKHLKRPVLLQLDRNNDFLGLGGRQACDAKWSVSVTDEGRITGLTKTVTSDAGFDKSGAFPATTLSCYDISNATLSSPMKVSQKPWGTIMRSPGEFQACFFMEAIIEQVARELGVDPTEIQGKNMLSGSDDEGVGQIWSDLKEQYASARTAVDDFNATHRWRKQGVYLQPIQFVQGAAVGFTGFNEKALVSVHADGSVAVDTSGIEQGQGLNTKVLQSAAMVFQQQVAGDFAFDQLESVLPKSTSHFSWSGVTPSYGSGTSEACVAAVIKACAVIAGNLSNYKSLGGWKQIVAAAAADSVELSATGVHPNSEGNMGYPVPMAALVVAEIDVLTGETQVLRADIVQDCGKSMNPAVDVGQIEGCFIQALGFCLMEEQVHSEVDQRLVTNGTWDYKIPSGLDIPITMTVKLPKGNNTTSGNVLGSKATGEPTYCVGSVTFFAVKDAILAARKEAGLSGHFRLNIPASPSAIQKACAVEL